MKNFTHSQSPMDESSSSNSSSLAYCHIMEIMPINFWSLARIFNTLDKSDCKNQLSPTLFVPINYQKLVVDFLYKKMYKKNQQKCTGTLKGNASNQLAIAKDQELPVRLT